MQSGCATALVLNKWDLAGELDLEHERARVASRLRLRPRVLTASATTGRNVARAAGRGDRARRPHGASASRRRELNRFLADLVATRQPPARQGNRLKLLYMAQVGVRPPRFAVQVNHRAPPDARLRLLPREPPARPLPARGRPAGDRLRRARPAPRRGRTPRDRRAGGPFVITCPRRVTETATPPRDRGPPGRRPRRRVPAQARARARRRRAAGPRRRAAAALVRRRLAAGRGRGQVRPGAGARLGPRLDRPRPRRRAARASTLAKRFPSYGRVQDRLLARLASGAQPVRYDRDLAPWLGEEVGLALLDTTGQTAGTLIVAAVADRGKADAYLRRAGQSSTATYRGVAIRRFGTVASTITGGYLLIGQESVLRGVIDSTHGQGQTLAADADLPPSDARPARGPRGRRLPHSGRRAPPARSRRAACSGVAGVLLDQPALAGARRGAHRRGRRRASAPSIRSATRAWRAAARPRSAPSRRRSPSAVPKNAMAYVGISRPRQGGPAHPARSAATGAAGARIQQPAAHPRPGLLAPHRRQRRARRAAAVPRRGRAVAHLRRCPRRI